MPEWLKRLTATETRTVIAIGYVMAVLGFIYVLAFKPVPDQNKDLVNVLGGVVIGGTAAILSYYFGSSKNNETK
jgi:hypothetical protein